MLKQKGVDMVKDATSGASARPVEQGLREVFLEPLLWLFGQLRLYLAAYHRVGDGFQVKMRQKREERRKGTLAKEKARMQTLFPDQNLDDDDDDEEEELPPVVTWRQLESLQQSIQSIAAVIAFMSISIAVFVHELQYRGFVPPWELDCANPAADRVLCTINPSCSYGLVNTTVADNVRILTCFPLDDNRGLIDNLKIGNSALTLWLLVTVYFYYRYEANILSLRNHVEFVDRELEIHWLYTSGLQKWFMLEGFFLIISQVPYYSTDIVINSDLFSTRPTVYSLDGIIALLMSE
ncbi:hypothetical protein T484DRAFT_1817945 [Baffinella frigidus]|nr:hypothetical protein T484DRAFT_1817945 [Cryptophyta sp. CCMP2293]